MVVLEKNKEINDITMKNKILMALACIIIAVIVFGFYNETLSKPLLLPYSTKTEYGVCIHLGQFDDYIINQLKLLNCTWVRIDWIPGKMDSNISALKSNGIKILAILDHNTLFQKTLPFLTGNQT